MHDMQRILVPVDFSGSSTLALRHALELAQRFGATVEALHVYEVPHYLADVQIGGPGHPAVPVQAYLEQQASEQMEALRSAVSVPEGVVLDVRLTTGDPRDRILAEAERQNADLLVMGTHGRSGLRRLLLGSVAEQVVRRATMPVLMVREADAA